MGEGGAARCDLAMRSLCLLESSHGLGSRTTAWSAGASAAAALSSKSGSCRLGAITSIHTHFNHEHEKGRRHLHRATYSKGQSRECFAVCVLCKRTAARLLRGKRDLQVSLQWRRPLMWIVLRHLQLQQARLVLLLLTSCWVYRSLCKWSEKAGQKQEKSK